MLLNLIFIILITAIANAIEKIKYRLENEYELIWSDKGSKADKDGSFWKPKLRAKNEYFLTFINIIGNKEPTNIVSYVFTSSSSLAVFSTPAAYTAIWTDKGSGAKDNVEWWRPIAPAGFVCLGDFVTRNQKEIADWGGYVCVSKKWVNILSGADISRVWDDKGSKADHDGQVLKIGVDNIPYNYYKMHNGYTKNITGPYYSLTIPGEDLTNLTDTQLVKRYAPYLRFDSAATRDFNGLPTIYNDPHGTKEQQNMDSHIDQIPTYYHIYKSGNEGNEKSIAYFWYYSYQSPCLYDGLSKSIQTLIDIDDFFGLGISKAIIGTDPGECGEHNNDLEKIYINLNSDNSLKSITYSQHGSWYNVGAHEYKLEFHSTHATVYVGLKAHPSFHKSLTGIGGCGYFHDNRDGKIEIESWNNLQPADWITNDNGLLMTMRLNTDIHACKGTGCNWEMCETKAQILDNQVECTPLKCSGWATGCLPFWWAEEIEEAIVLADIDDKYALLYVYATEDHDCKDGISENVKGNICIPESLD